MSGNNLSPEEILKHKEAAGGHQYDSPADTITTELDENVYKEEVSKMVEANSPPYPEETTQEPQPTKQPLELGWKNLPLNIIPSMGRFYPEGTQIAIRAADVKEIRLYSMIDEDDMLDIDEKLNYVLDSCSRVKFGNHGVVTYLDLKKEDRFFIVMAIRDLTFVKGENRIIIKPKKRCTTEGCEGIEAIELRTGVLSNYKLTPELMQYYSPIDKKFLLPIANTNKVISMYVPSIGVSKAVSNFVRNSIKRGVEIDEAFIKIAPFYFEDWRELNDHFIMEAMIDSYNWTKEEFSAYFMLSELIKVGTKLQVKLKCDRCNAGEVIAPIYFPRGFRSLFVITDLFGELLRH